MQEQHRQQNERKRENQDEWRFPQSSKKNKYKKDLTHQDSFLLLDSRCVFKKKMKKK